MPDIPIVRQYCPIGERHVHYRIAGAGPAVVLLHQSPRNSAELTPLIRFLAPHFTVIAPDTPGYGLSDPLSDPDREPSIDDFVDALAAFLDALGLKRPALVGSHTGAIIATRYVARYPERVAALVANGILISSAEERSELCERYFPRLQPQWDGTHLAWLWSRIRDQHDFYPWYQRQPTARMQWFVSLEQLHASALDLLEAGDDYRGAYRAVLDYAIAEDLKRLHSPSLLLVARPDALVRYVDDYPRLPDHVAVEVVDGFADIPSAILAYLQRIGHRGDWHPTSAPGGRSLGLQRRFVETSVGLFHLHEQRQGSGRPLLILHDVGGSAAGLRPMLGGLAGCRPLVAPDLPGHGATEVAGALKPDETAAALAELLDALALPRVDVAAIGASAAFALALGDAAPERVAGLALIEPPACRAGRLTPDVAPDDAGSHLFRAWYYLRDRHLFSPWDERSADTMLAGAQAPHPLRLHRELIDLLKTERLEERMRSAVGALAPDRLRDGRALVLATAGSAVRRALPDAALLPDEPYHWGGHVAGLLDGRVP